MDSLLLALLVPGLLFFIATSLILVHNHLHFMGLAGMHSDTDSKRSNGPKPPLDAGAPEPEPLVSILIPARNEERNLPKLLESLRRQDWPRMEIHVLDDHSEDQTRRIAEAFKKRVDEENKNRSGSSPATHHTAIGCEVFVHSSDEKPSGWLGKNWACHQLSEYANGDIFIFLDADTWLAPDAVSGILAAMEKFHLDFATVWPHQVMKTIAEKAVVSTVYSTVATYLPTKYSFRAPSWIPNRTLREKVKPLFANACGQCMIFTNETYRVTGGHQSVRNQVVEDVMLAKNVVKSGRTMRMFHGTDRLWCRMYSSSAELFQGFRKNFFAGFGYRYLPFLAAWLLHLVAYLLPVLILVAAISTPETVPIANPVLGLSASMVAIAFLQRMWVAFFLKWPLSTAPLYLPGVLWFQVLAFVVLRDHFSNTRPTWKGRSV
jgi:chlorobactene glucosyltransferase